MRWLPAQPRQRAGRRSPLAGLLLMAACAGQPDKATDSVAHSQDSQTASDAVHVNLPDPVTCPVGQPPALVSGEIVPNFHGCATEWPAPVLHGGGAVADDHLHAALVQWGDEGAALVHGDWLGLHQGIQGTGHALTGLHVELGDAGPTATVDLVTATWYSCDTVIAKPLRQLQLVATAKPGWYASTEPLFWLINMPVHLSCGRWFQLQVFTRRHGTLNWSKTDATVRMYSLEPFE